MVSIFVFIFGSFVQKIKYDLVPRAPYSFGLDSAFKQAKSQAEHDPNIKRLLIIEFGVASGAGLINLVNKSKKLSNYYNLECKIIGFDSGEGLPHSIDYRDHPEKYLFGDFVPSDINSLKSKLPNNAKLYIGDIRQTLMEFNNDVKHGDSCLCVPCKFPPGTIRVDPLAGTFFYFTFMTIIEKL